MLSVLCQNGRVEKNDVLRRVDTLSRSLTKLDYEIALDGHGNLETIVIILAAIKSGLRLAFCPVKDPPLSLNTWLKDLNIKNVIATERNLDFLNHDFNVFGIDYLNNIKIKEYEKAPPGFCSILRTSGTTGLSKNAVISYAAHEASALSVNEYFQFDQKSVWCLNLPLFHVSGLSVIFRALMAQASLYLASSYEAMVGGVLEKQITHLSLVPAQLKRLFDDEVNLSHVKSVIVSGDTLPLRLKFEAIKRRVNLYEAYGLTETASMIWVRKVSDNEGVLLPHAVMDFASDNEILVGGKSSFSGYLKNGVLLKHDGLFATGDLKNHNSEPFILGRKNNRIISGGENIQAEEIEIVLEKHPKIEAAVVVGIADEKYGMRPCAFVKCVRPFDACEIGEYLRLHLASYKLPKFIKEWPSDAPNQIKKPRAWFSNNVK